MIHGGLPWVLRPLPESSRDSVSESTYDPAAETGFRRPLDVSRTAPGRLPPSPATLEWPHPARGPRSPSPNVRPERRTSARDPGSDRDSGLPHGPRRSAPL
ncbi:hypothetical protein BQ8420_30720 [Nocardiopsis sp. JB363]|nr:hypothetical protein BQ8420_30720 [Nocardiopsis sp. JB363]